MELEGSLPHSQVPATCPYPEPARSRPYLHIPLPEEPSYYYPLIYIWLSQVVSFPLVSPPKPCIRLSSPPYALLSLFCCSGCTKGSVQFRGKCSRFVTRYVFTVRSCQHLFQTEAGGPPLVGCARLLIQYIGSYPPFWRLFLHPQPEDAACHSDRDPLITVTDTDNFH